MSHEHPVIFLWGPRRLAVKFCDISSVNNCFIITRNTAAGRDFRDGSRCMYRSRDGFMTLMGGGDKPEISCHDKAKVRRKLKFYLKGTVIWLTRFKCLTKNSQSLEVHWKVRVPVVTSDSSLKVDVKPSNGCVSFVIQAKVSPKILISV